MLFFWANLVLQLDDGFKCPNQTQFAPNGHVMQHPRYLNELDCRLFYVCQDGERPVEVGCPEGTVFDDVSLNCEAPELVKGW